MSDRILAAVMEAPHHSEAGHFLRALSLLERHAPHVPWDAIGSQ